ncbi:hypothetical protein NECID01_1505 [Nematocida sp. AWRm77]|nr:hypothetical protein NECID01_1505 [Nematocida sp. AWRm77]
MGFKEFLGETKEIGECIDRLGREVSRAEKVLAVHRSESSRSSVVAQEMTILSKKFYLEAEGIKERIQKLAETAEDTKRECHITSLFKRLAVQLDKFYLVKNITELIVSDKEEEDHSSNETPPADYRTESLQSMVADMANLEYLSIKLNMILDSSGNGLDKVAIKAAETRTVSESTNTRIVSGIAQRKRRRKLKHIFIILLSIGGIIACTYLGSKVLDFFIKLKEVSS